MLKLTSLITKSGRRFRTPKGYILSFRVSTLKDELVKVYLMRVYFGQRFWNLWSLSDTAIPASNAHGVHFCTYVTVIPLYLILLRGILGVKERPSSRNFETKLSVRTYDIETLRYIELRSSVNNTLRHLFLFM